MRRRRIPALLAGAALLAASPRGMTQQRRTQVVGWLGGRSPGESAHLVDAFRRGLEAHGFVEGRNLRIEFRWAEGHYDRLAVMAAELVRMPADVVFAAGGAPPARAAKAATSVIPIVFSAISDPVSLGLVTSLNRPGANVTGMAVFSALLAPKRIELLHEVLPSARRLAMLFNPEYPFADIEARDAASAASVLGKTVERHDARTAAEIVAVLDKVAAERAEAMIVGTDPYFDSQRELIASLTLRHALASCTSFADHVAAGALISYGISIAERYQQAGAYVGRILRGERPGDLPVQQPTTFELAINLKTARALGITVPQSVLLQATEIIE